MTFARRAARDEYTSKYEQPVVADLGWHHDGLGLGIQPTQVWVGTSSRLTIKDIAQYVRRYTIILDEDLEGLGHLMQPWPLLYRVADEGSTWGARWQSADTELGTAVGRSMIAAGALRLVKETNLRTRELRQVMRVRYDELDTWEAARLLLLEDDA